MGACPEEVLILAGPRRKEQGSATSLSPPLLPLHPLPFPSTLTRPLRQRSIARLRRCPVALWQRCVCLCTHVVCADIVCASCGLRACLGGACVGRRRSLTACQEGARAGGGEQLGRREGVGWAGGRAGGREGEAGATDISFPDRFDLACMHVCTFWRRPTMLAMKRSLSSSSCFLSSPVLFECSPLGVEMGEGGWG